MGRRLRGGKEGRGGVRREGRVGGGEWAHVWTYMVGVIFVVTSLVTYAADEDHAGAHEDKEGEGATRERKKRW